MTLTGHAGYDAHGRDIVCAAVSAAADLTVHLAESYFGVRAEVSADSPGNLHVSLPGREEAAHKLFSGLRDYLEATAQAYPQKKRSNSKVKPHSPSRESVKLSAVSTSPAPMCRKICFTPENPATNAPGMDTKKNSCTPVRSHVRRFLSR